MTSAKVTQAGSTPARGTNPAKRRLLALAASVVAALTVAFVVAAPAASAHATVVSSSPGDHEKLSTAPTSVSIRFSETVSISNGGLSVIDAKGHRVDNGDDRQPQGESLESTLKPGLTDGTYIANYAIISADGHPIRGSIVFGVGNAALSDVSGLTTTTDPTFDALSKAGQFFTYLGVMLAAGLAFFMAFVLDDGPDRSRLTRATRVATAVATVGIGWTILMQAALEGGSGIGAIADWTVLRPVLTQGVGWQSALQIVGLVACLVSLTPRRTVSSQILALYGGLAATGSFVLFGHASQTPYPWLTIPADIVHVAVGAVWLGGLVGLATVLRHRARQATVRAGTAGSSIDGDAVRAAGLDAPAAMTSGSASTATALLERTDVTARSSPRSEAPGGSPGDGGLGGPRGGDDVDRVPADDDDFGATVGVVSRFSSVAALSVGLLAVAGLVLGVIEVGSISNLFTTTYGQLVIAKLAVVGVILLLAAYNRYSLLPRLTGDDRPGLDEGPGASRDPGWSTLLRALRFEALGIVVVLAITSVLANTTPSRSLPPAAVPFSDTRAFGNGSMTFDITPNRAGVNQLIVQFTDASGAPDDSVQGVSAYFTLKANGVGPLNENLVKTGPGRYQLDQTPDLSIPGEWTTTLQVRVSEFANKDVDFTDTVQ